jgi:hypothetical protein
LPITVEGQAEEPLAAEDRGERLQLGPIVVAPVDEGMAMRTLAPRRAEVLCGRRLDWVEAIAP